MLDLSVLNYPAMLVCVVIHMALGSVWYSPLLFGNKWLKMVKMSDRSPKQMKETMIRGMTVSVIGAIVMAFVLAIAMEYAGVVTFAGGMHVGLILWIGILAPSVAANYAFTQKSLALFAIDTLYPLVSMCIMGGILGVWI